MDTGSLSKAQPETIRILVWLLSFLSFGYATAEFEVTSERLGVYRPEERELNLLPLLCLSLGSTALMCQPDIDNPKDYNDNKDARVFDPRLRGPIRPIELQIDPETGMKNYIANQKGDWATSAAFVKYSFERSIHHGRLYMNGHGFFKGSDEDLAEALRCLGQGLHTLEDFGAHTNYTELALRELGYQNVFTHTGTATQINLRGKHVFPLVTGTFGMVDFYHSVLGEATDHFAQSEVNEMDNALGTAQQASQSSSPVKTLISLLSKVPGTRDLCAEAEQLQRTSSAQARQLEQEGQGGLTLQQQGWNDHGSYRGMDNRSYDGISRGPGDWNQSRVSQPDWSAPQASYLQNQSSFHQEPTWTPHSQGDWSQHQQQEWNQPVPQWNQPQQPQWNQPQQSQWDPQHQPHWDQQQHAPPDYNQQPHSQSFSQQGAPAAQQQSSQANKPPAGLPGMPNFDPKRTIQQIYPILAFRDKVVRSISAVIEKIPGFEALVDKITETLTIFILSLLAPFVRPVIDGISKSLQAGSSGIVDASGQHQYEPWTDPNCSNPTHSLLSKDHFSNILNQPAGAVAVEILRYVAPKVLYAWQHTDIPVERVTNDCLKVFHHPAIRDSSVEVHRTMFDAVQKWVHSRADGGSGLNNLLSSESVRAGKNLTGLQDHAGNTHNPVLQFGDMGFPGAGFAGSSSQHQQQQQPQSQSGSGGLGSFGGFAGFGGQQHQQQHQGGSGGFDPLAQLSRLPIPGLSSMTSQVNKFSSFLPGGFGGSSRGINEDPVEVQGAISESGQGDPYRAHTPNSSMNPGSGYDGYGQGREYHPPDSGTHNYAFHSEGGGGANDGYHRG